MSATKIIRYVNSNRLEISQYKDYISSLDWNVSQIESTKKLCDRLSSELRFSETSIENVLWRLKELKNSHLRKIGELVSTGREERIEEVVLKPSYSIGKSRFKLGDLVRLNKDAWSDHYDKIKSPVGTVVLKSIEFNKYEQEIDMMVWVCFGDGKTVKVYDYELNKISPKKRDHQKKQALTLVESDDDGDL